MLADFLYQDPETLMIFFIKELSLKHLNCGVLPFESYRGVPTVPDKRKSTVHGARVCKSICVYCVYIYI